MGLEDRLEHIVAAENGIEAAEAARRARFDDLLKAVDNLGSEFIDAAKRRGLSPIALGVSQPNIENVGANDGRRRWRRSSAPQPRVGEPNAVGWLICCRYTGENDYDELWLMPSGFWRVGYHTNPLISPSLKAEQAADGAVLGRLQDFATRAMNQELRSPFHDPAGALAQCEDVLARGLLGARCPLRT